MRHLYIRWVNIINKSGKTAGGEYNININQLELFLDSNMYLIYKEGWTMAISLNKIKFLDKFLKKVGDK